MQNIRQAAVAGLFYPDNSKQLSQDIEHYLAKVANNIQLPKAIIVPHAGYIYSAPIAASAYTTIVNQADKINRVVLLGPSHHLAFNGVAITSAEAYATPLGLVDIETRSKIILQSLNAVICLDQAHTKEHSLEVHLPFLQTILNDFEIIPIVTGNIDKFQLAEVLRNIWGGDETLIVVSSDLSHYLEYHSAQQMDQGTSNCIETLEADKISSSMACGHIAIKGLLEIAKQQALIAKTIDVRNSGDTAGNKQRVVGYGAYVFH